MPSLASATGRFSLLSLGMDADEGVGLATPPRALTPVARAMRPLAEDPVAKAARQSAELARALSSFGMESNRDPLAYRKQVVAMTLANAS